MTREPTFLFCLGAPKTATSWLWEYLCHHPQAWFRTIKEYNFFFLGDGASFDTAIARGAERVERQRAWAHSLSGPEAVRPLRYLSELEAWQRLLETRRADPAAYRAFLTEGRGERHLVGDLTPAYALLGGDKLRQMSAMGRSVRFLYLMRDPLARLWSHVRMSAATTYPDRPLEDASRQMLEDVISGPVTQDAKWIAERGNYAEHLDKFRSVLGAHRMLVMFTDDLLTHPGVARLCRFLGIADDHPAELSARIHAGTPLALPEDLTGRALHWLRPQYAAARRFGHLPAAWQTNMERAFA